MKKLLPIIRPETPTNVAELRTTPALQEPKLLSTKANTHTVLRHGDKVYKPGVIDKGIHLSAINTSISQALAETIQDSLFVSSTIETVKEAPKQVQEKLIGAKLVITQQFDETLKEGTWEDLGPKGIVELFSKQEIPINILTKSALVDILTQALDTGHNNRSEIGSKNFDSEICLSTNPYAVDHNDEQYQNYNYLLSEYLMP